MTDTSHIQACRSAWIRHRLGCEQCSRAIEDDTDLSDLCESGGVIYHEYISAITAHKDCESLEAKP